MREEKYESENNMYFSIDAVDCDCCFTSGAYTEVYRAKREDKIDIDLIIVDELLNK